MQSWTDTPKPGRYADPPLYVSDDPQQQEKINWSVSAKAGFGTSFWTFAAIGAVLGFASYLVLGPATFFSAISDDGEMLANLLPRVLAAQLVAGFVWVLLPRDQMARILQRGKGRRGLPIAAIAGIVTPGGPASAFSLLAVLAAGGADRGILVSYITAWALLGMQRIIVWDIPFMGFDFSLLRFVICLPLPIIAGILARRLPHTTPLQSVSSPSEPGK